MRLMGVGASKREAQIAAGEFSVSAAGIIEVTADQIADESDDSVVRQRAHLWKIEAVPQLQKAAFQSDPAIALVDLWVFCVQMREYFESGSGVDRFGGHQRLATSATTRIENEVIELVKSLLHTEMRAEFSAMDWDVRRAVYTWASRHPLDNDHFIRESIASRYSDFMAGKSTGLFVAPGAASEQMQVFLDRSAVYALQTQKLLQWHEAWLLERTDQAIGEQRALVAQSISEESSRLLDAVDRMISRQEDSLMFDVSEERAVALRFLREERALILAALREERMAAIAALHDERVATIEELRAVTLDFLRETLNEGENHANAVLDRTLLRTSRYVALTLVLLLVLVPIGVGLTRRAMLRQDRQ
jgi:hypothetical protein